MCKYEALRDSSVLFLKLPIISHSAARTFLRYSTKDIAKQNGSFKKNCRGGRINVSFLSGKTSFVYNTEALCNISTFLHQSQLKDLIELELFM